MKGVIFAAGLGTRLYPLTKDIPKALVEVCGMTMLEHTLEKMRAAGIVELIVNVHAFADKVESWLKSYSLNNPNMSISISDERELLLETGGGLKIMQSFLSDKPFLVHNVDVLSNIGLLKLLETDNSFSGNLATLAVRKTESDRYFLFNENGLLCGWENVMTGEQKISRPWENNLQRYGFTGIHLIHPEIFPLMTEEGVFSITDVYLRLSIDHEIRMLDVTGSSWFDIGSYEQLAVAEQKYSTYLF